MLDNAPDNTEEIEKSQQRNVRLRRWFYGWLAALPLTVLVGAAGLVFSDGPSTGIGVFFLLFTFLAPLVCLGGLLWVSKDSWNSRRRVGVAQEFDLMGFEYIDQPALRKLGFLLEFQSFAGSHSHKATSLGRGRYRDDEVLVLDFSCTWGNSNDQRWAAQTIVVLTDAVRGVPGMLVQPLGFWERSPLPVRGEERFNKMFSLASVFFKEAPQFITPDVAAFCVAEGKIVLEVRNGDLLVFRKGMRLQPEDLLDAVKSAACAARLLRTARDQWEG